ncbi:MAG: ribonuclease R [Acidobacteria bacterium]|nr:ribonuclease R [Acidobacteriota bacterium]
MRNADRAESAMSAGEVVERIREHVGHPATIKELMRVLAIPNEERYRFRRRIKQLVEAGELIRIRGNRYGLADRMRLVVGRLQVNPRGFGFVAPEHAAAGAGDDIFVAGVNLHQAMHGDRVAIRLERVAGRPEGRIVRVIERANQELVGRYDVDASGVGFVLPFDQRVVMDVQIPAGATGGASSGQMVVVEIDRWPTATRNPIGRIIEVIGVLGDPGVDTTLIIRKHRIPEAHEPAVVAEAKRLGDAVKRRDLKGRTDFRTVLTVTIDGETARDFDDAITLEVLPNGHHWLGVHIADVAHYVKEGGALDEAAYTRGTSVYFPERALHMFPAPLATGLCSLKPGVDRLVQSCLMEVDRHGAVLRYELHDGVICSDARMTYTEVEAILTRRDPDTRRQYAELVPLFGLMDTVYRRLNARRVRRGSIDFDLKATQLVLDEAGMVEDIVAADRNVAHRIIEEFMLAANETVARHLRDSELPALFRVHEPPDPAKVADFDAFTVSLGYGLGAPAGRVRPRHFQQLLKRLHGQPEERPVALLMLRTMQKAQYDAVNIGHFGLASETYTHFTSPIRRYPDLVVHRLLRESREGGPSVERVEELTDELPDIGRHTSAMERRAEEAEREIVQWKKVRFMTDKVGDEFTGYVTGVTGFGLFVELVEHFVEGLVHISSMADDYYRFLDSDHALFGENTGKTYRLGDTVNVQVVRVDTERRQIDLGIVAILEAVRKSERNRGPQRSRVTRRARVPRGGGRGGRGGRTRR